MFKITLGLVVGILVAVLALAPAGSTGTAAQRMRAMRTAAVEETTTTTTTAVPVEPAPVVTTPTTQIAEPAVVVAPVPTAPVPVPVAAKPVVTPGHYSCPGDQDHQYDTPCALDTADDPGPNAGSDDPATTVAGADAGYAGRMIDGFCEAKPILCDDPDHPIL